MDAEPVFVYFTNDNNISWYCAQMLPLLCKINLALNVRLEDYIREIKSKLIQGNLLPFDEISAFQKQKKCSIYCFSEVDITKSVLLWSHYAEQHKGVALGFTFHSEYNKYLHEVNYHPKNIKAGVFTAKEFIQIYRSSIDDFISEKEKEEFENHFFRKCALTKHMDWKYEHEWRMISSPSAPENKLFLPLTDGLLSHIYLGLNYSGNKNILIEEVKKKYPRAKVYETTKHNKFIKLETRLIWPV